MSTELPHSPDIISHMPKKVEKNPDTSTVRASAWLYHNIDLLEDNPIRRELNRVVAVSLLSNFRQNPALWRDCGWLNHWDVRKDITFSEYLNS